MVTGLAMIAVCGLGSLIVGSHAEDDFLNGFGAGLIIAALTVIMLNAL